MRLDQPVRVEDEKDALDNWVAVAQIITAAGVPFLAWQILGARGEGRRQRTRGFQERYLEREFQKTASLTVAYLDATDVEDCVEKVRAYARRGYVADPCLPRTPRARDGDVPNPSALDVAQVMGFFEDFGTAYNRRDLDREVVRDSFSRTPVQIFSIGWWYDDAHDELWKIDSAPPGRRTGWEAIVIPPTLEVDLESWVWRRTKVNAITRRLGQLGRDSGIEEAIDRLEELAARHAASAAA